MALRKITVATKNPQDEKLGFNWEGPYVVSNLRNKYMYVNVTCDGKQVPRPWNTDNL